MEVTEKDRARQAFRDRKASHRHASARRGWGAPGAGAVRPAEELASNDFRYGESDEEAEQDPGQRPRQSQGADLAALLEESLQLDRGLMCRMRRQLDLEAEAELPPGAMEAAEKALAVDYGALAARLSALPLHELLGVEPQLFSAEAGAADPADQAHQPQPGVGAGEAPAARSAAPPAAERPDARVAPSAARGGSAEGAAQPELGAATPAAPPVVPAVRTAPAVAQPPPAPRPQPAQQQQASGADAELDALLGMARAVGPAPRASAAGAPRTEVGKPTGSGAVGQDSLDDWLDSL